MEDDYGREIDSLIRDKKLTDVEFQTYTKEYCWYCGRPYSAIDGIRHFRIIEFTRTEKETKGLREIKTTHKRTVSVPECTQCRAFHSVNDKKTNTELTIVMVISMLFIAGILASLFLSIENKALLIIVIVLCIPLAPVLMVIGSILGAFFIYIYEHITHAEEKNPKPKLRSESDIPQVIKAKKEGFGHILDPLHLKKER